MKNSFILLFTFFCLSGYSQEDYKSITFHSLDSLEITANLYEIGEDAPTIVLCHQARFNKFEYEGVAQVLNEKGFNCLAIDQRSGGPIANQLNQTNLKAVEENKGVDYLDAIQDITAAVNYAANRYNKPIILWGSSYSSTLVLYEAINNENVKAVVSFSPGNYFQNELGSLVDKLEDFKKPFFITSSLAEIPGVEKLLAKVKFKKKQVHFKPNGGGHHGSRALWPHQTGGEEYWEAISKWLSKIK